VSARNYWIGVVSRSHVRLSVEGGFIQLDHGKKAPLERLHAGDGLLIYSPKTAHPDVEYLPCEEAPIRPLIDELFFIRIIRSKTHRGAASRFGLVKVPAADFVSVAEAMGCDTLANAWYKVDPSHEDGQIEVLAQDPDGYSLRLVQVLGSRAE